ncbi:hypothetical protein SAMN05444156_1388 [Verrucomicrobium sp. GAS474]|uniref:hypothetical protein n=1 Tax=Verrucomicrobium sp. GAS474 TaxID=1882831 RepID=UPI00087D84C7|nr:hypothetical protein [Verrucomicrobium sp. GAS474]SDU00479.1 hypothetical protein SAMN05444156_1388 [Verrucomicrobium sp. GAS474]
MEDASGKTADRGSFRLVLFAGGSVFLHLLGLLLLVLFFHNAKTPGRGFAPAPSLSLSFLNGAAAARPAAQAQAQSHAAASAAPTPEAVPAPPPVSPVAVAPIPPPPPTSVPAQGQSPGQESAPAETMASSATAASSSETEAGTSANTSANTGPSASGSAASPQAGPGTLSLYGVEGSGRRIVLVFDVSDSIFLRRPGLFDTLYAEALARIDTLPPAVLFDLIVFKNGSLAWKGEPLPATEANRAEARRWLAKVARQGIHFSVKGGTPGVPSFEGNGTRGDTALRQAISLAPDWIIVVTDGQWQVTGANARPDPIRAEALLADLRARADSLPKIDILLLTSRKTTAQDNAITQALSEQSGGNLVPLADEVVAAH